MGINLCLTCGNWERCDSRHYKQEPVYDCSDYFSVWCPSLKCCPKCKSKRIRLKIVSESHGMDGHCYDWHISCGNCGINVNYAADAFYDRKFYTYDQVIAEWNKRE